MHFIRILVLLTLLLSGPWAAHAAEPTGIEREPRLAKRFSVSEKRIHLGDLLERISRSTGVPLTADERKGPISGYELTAVIRELPARELLQAVAQLYSYPPDRWYWEKRGSGSEAGYILRNTLSPEELRNASFLGEEELLIRQWRRINNFYAAPPATQEAVVKADANLQGLQNPAVRMHFSIVSKLSEEELIEVARGKQIKIPTSELSSSQQDYLQEAYQRAGLLGKPGVVQPEELKHLTVQGFGTGRAVVLDLGEAGSYPVLGGQRERRLLRSEILAHWIAAGGNREVPASAVPAAGQKVKPEELNIRQETLDRIFHRLGSLAETDLLLDYPPGSGRQTFDSEQRLAGSLPEVLGGLERLAVMWKRSHGVLLLHPDEWLRQPRQAAVPWPLLRSLRTSAEKNQGYLQLGDWYQLAELRPEQLDYLSEEFPDAPRLKQFQVLLRFAAAMNGKERAALSRAQGAGWEDWSPRTRQRLLVLLPPAEARKSRMLLQWEQGKAPPRLRLYLGSGDEEPRPVEVEFRPRRRLEEVAAKPGEGAAENRNP